MSTALYRRYRPDTFADVIGQGHVTAPLMQALRTGKVTHAYLFSGPRGCGKTTSARILARCLNCAEGPTDNPCGKCESCLELATGGPGSLDVVEIDAASHNGVDDARDLRERAAFAPTRDRYKIFILDEAHMVTSQGFNALLKIVEEPPPHIKFIFATTEPDKVIGTIRSRTHHYPFRLVAPDVLTPYLEQLCASEGLEPAAGVLPLVVRAGGGSVRDTLSVMDQLAAGAVDGQVPYDSAIALLGYTPSSLLQDTVDAIAALDGASLFRIIERVIDTGHEPRRFVEDLLERLRDLIVLAVSGPAGEATLQGVPVDQLAHMRTQAQNLGPANLSRAADLTHSALSEMTGATSPRLHLELLAARLLLPAATGDELSLATRLERLERGINSSPMPQPAPAPAPEPTPAPAAPVVQAAPEPTREPAPKPVSTPAPDPTPEPDPIREPALDPAPQQAGQNTEQQEAEMLRRRWPEVLETINGMRKATWVLVSQNAQVASLTAESVGLSFNSPGLETAFSSGPHAEVVAQAIQRTLGFAVRVEIAKPGSGLSAASGPKAQALPKAVSWEGESSPKAEPAANPEPASPTANTDADSPRWHTSPSPPEPEDDPDYEAEAYEQYRAESPTAPAESSGLIGTPLVVKMLDATVIDEILDEEPHA